jgi:hypothetical protein
LWFLYGKVDLFPSFQVGQLISLLCSTDYGIVVLHQGREPGKADRLDRLPKIHISFVCFSSQRKKNPNLFQTELN